MVPVFYDEKKKTKRKKIHGRKVDFFGRNNVEMMAMFWPWPFVYVAKERIVEEV